MADARTAILITLDPNHEGGFQKNPNDRANWTGGQIGVGTLVGTKYGITALDMPGVDIASITQSEAITYYTENYWRTYYSQINDQSVASKLFDMGVLFGVGTAVRLLQIVLDIANPDCIFGPETLAATNQANPTILLNSYKDELHEHATKVAANNPADAPDLSDWQRRIDS